MEGAGYATRAPARGQQSSALAGPTEAADFVCLDYTDLEQNGLQTLSKVPTSRLDAAAAISVTAVPHAAQLPVAKPSSSTDSIAQQQHSLHQHAGCSPQPPPSSSTVSSSSEVHQYGAVVPDRRCTADVASDESQDSDNGFDEDVYGADSEAESSDTFSDVGDPATTEVIYVREGVAVWPSRFKRILGRLSLVKQHAVMFMAWLPYSAPTAPSSPTVVAEAAAEADTASVDVANTATAAAAADKDNSDSDTSSRPAPRMTSIEAASAAVVDSASAAVPPPNGSAIPEGLGDVDDCDWLSSTDEFAPAAAAALDDFSDSSSSDGSPSNDWVRRRQQQHRVNVPVPLAAPKQQRQQQQQQQQPCVAPGSLAEPGRQPSRSSCTTATAAVAGSSDASRSMYAVHPVPISDIKAFVKHTPSIGQQHITVVLNSGLTLPPLLFPQGGAQEFVTVLQQHVSLVKAAHDPSTYLVNDTADPLQRSLIALDIVDIMLGAPPPGVSCVQAPGVYALQGATASGVKHQDQQQQQNSSRNVGTVLGGWQEVDPPAAAAAAAAGQQRPVPHASSTLNQHVVMPAASSGSSSSGRSSPVPAHSPQHRRPRIQSLGSLGTLSSALGNQLTSVLANYPVLRHHQGVANAVSSTVGSTLSKVGQLAVEGASSLVAAAVEGWHTDAMRYFEQEVQIPDEWRQEIESLGMVHGEDDSFTRRQQQQQHLGQQQQQQQQQQSVRHQHGDWQQQQQPQQQQHDGLLGGGHGNSTSSSCCSSKAGSTHATPDGAVAAAVAAAVGRNALAPAAAAAAANSGSSTGCARPAAADGDIDTDLGVFELLDRSVGPHDHLSAVRSRAAPPPLTADELQLFMDDRGVMHNEAGFRERVFQGGIDPAARREAWKMLLGVYPLGGSTTDRQHQHQQRQQQYAALVAEWKGLRRGAGVMYLKGRERRDRIAKDVRRTDRQHPFYRGSSARAHLTSLSNVLHAYSIFNSDVGYCQGMSDLVSPLLVVMEGEEVDTFWCYVGLMERLSTNFAKDQAGMHLQLAALRQLVQVLDPQLHAFLEARDCLNYFFAFRWLLIHFKREFAFEQVLTLWEAFWSCPLTTHLHLYMAAAVLIHHRRVLLSDEGLDFDGMLRFCVELSGKIDLQGTLRLAEVLVVMAGQVGKDCLKGLP